MRLTDYPQVQELLEELCRKIKSKSYAAEVRDEVLAHLGDAVAEKLRAGFSEEKAVLSTVASFGDPSEIGRELRRGRYLISESPLIWGLLILIMIVLNHYLFFGGHIGQMVEPKAFLLIFVLALAGVLLARRHVTWRSAGLSLFRPARALSRRDRVRAWFFFEIFSRNIQGLSVGVGIVATVGMGVHAYLQPSTFGVWVATAWLAYFYGLVFGVLLARVHAINLRSFRTADESFFRSRNTARSLSGFVQGLAPVLVIQALIGLISHVDLQSSDEIFQGLIRIGYGILGSAVIVGLLPVEPRSDSKPGSFAAAVSRLEQSALLYRTTPLFAAVTVAIVLIAV